MDWLQYSGGYRHFCNNCQLGFITDQEYSKHIISIRHLQSFAQTKPTTTSQSNHCNVETSPRQPEPILNRFTANHTTNPYKKVNNADGLKRQMNDRSVDDSQKLKIRKVEGIGSVDKAPAPMLNDPEKKFDQMMAKSFLNSCKLALHIQGIKNKDGHHTSPDQLKPNLGSTNSRRVNKSNITVTLTRKDIPGLMDAEEKDQNQSTSLKPAGKMLDRIKSLLDNVNKYQKILKKGISQEKPDDSNQVNDAKLNVNANKSTDNNNNNNNDNNNDNNNGNNNSNNIYNNPYIQSNLSYSHTIPSIHNNTITSSKITTNNTTLSKNTTNYNSSNNTLSNITTSNILNNTASSITTPPSLSNPITNLTTTINTSTNKTLLTSPRTTTNKSIILNESLTANTPAYISHQMTSVSYANITNKPYTTITTNINATSNTTTLKQPTIKITTTTTNINNNNNNNKTILKDNECEISKRLKPALLPTPVGADTGAHKVLKLPLLNTPLLSKELVNSNKMASLPPPPPPLMTTTTLLPSPPMVHHSTPLLPSPPSSISTPLPPPPPFIPGLQTPPPPPLPSLLPMTSMAAMTTDEMTHDEKKVMSHKRSSGISHNRHKMAASDLTLDSLTTDKVKDMGVTEMMIVFKNLLTNMVIDLVNDDTIKSKIPTNKILLESLSQRNELMPPSLKYFANDQPKKVSNFLSILRFLDSNITFGLSLLLKKEMDGGGGGELAKFPGLGSWKDESRCISSASSSAAAAAKDESIIKHILFDDDDDVSGGGGGGDSDGNFNRVEHPSKWFGPLLPTPRKVGLLPLPPNDINDGTFNYNN